MSVGLCATLAEQKNRSVNGWGLLSLIFGPLAVSLITVLPKIEEDRPSITKETVLGSISPNYLETETIIEEIPSDTAEIAGIEYKNKKTNRTVAVVHYTGDLPEYIIGFNTAGKMTGKAFYKPDGNLDRIYLIDPQTKQKIEIQRWENNIKTQAEIRNTKGALVKYVFYRQDGTKEKEDIIIKDRITQTNFYNFTGEEIIDTTN